MYIAGKSFVDAGMFENGEYCSIASSMSHRSKGFPTHHIHASSVLGHRHRANDVEEGHAEDQFEQIWTGIHYRYPVPCPANCPGAA